MNREKMKNNEALNGIFRRHRRNSMSGIGERFT